MNSSNNDDLKFKESTHEYRLKNRHIPSVTQILKPVSNELYHNIDRQTLNNKANIGTLVHRCIEQYNKWGIKNKEDNERVMNYFNSYLEWEKTLESSFIWDNEYKGCYTSNEMVFAGTIDNIRMIGNDLYLIDYKTTATINETIVALQLYGYKLIAEQKLGMQINKFAALGLREDGYDFHDLTYMVNDLETKEFFETLYKLHTYFEDYGIKGY